MPMQMYAATDILTKLIPAILKVLESHGLLSSCFDGPVPWIGTPAQIDACAELHNVLITSLPPLQKGT